MAVSLRQKYTQYYSKFIEALPMNDIKFLASLREAGLFPGNTYDKVTSKPTPAERAEEFLRSNIQSGFFLDDNTNDSLDKLFKIMARSEYPNPKALARLFGYGKSLLSML